MGDLVTVNTDHSLKFFIRLRSLNFVLVATYRTDICAIRTSFWGEGGSDLDLEKLNGIPNENIKSNLTRPRQINTRNFF